MPATRRISRAEIVATHLSMDAGDIRDYLYHYGKTAAPVFAIGNSCYTVASKSELRAVEAYYRGEWTPVNDAKAQEMAAKSGRIVYVSNSEG